MRRQAHVQGLGILLALVASLFLTSSAARAQNKNTGNIVGKVRLPGGPAPPEPVLVTIQTRGAIINSTYCDNEGRFVFQDLLANPYHIFVNAEGYEPVHQIAVVAPAVSPNTHVLIVLRPLQTPPPENPPGPASGGNPHMVSLAEFEKKVSPQARKEFEAALKADGHDQADEAIRHYQKAVALAPDFYAARNNLGTKYLSKGEFQAAESEFAEVIKLNQNDAQAYFNLGNVFYLTKRYPDALRTLQEGLKRQPNSALGHYLLGSVYVRTGEFGQGERSLRSALELDPKMSRVRVELANLCLQQGRTAEAIGELKSFVKLFPHDPLLPKVKEVLKKLENSTPPAQVTRP